jgi:hypothetical protein
MRCRLRTCSAVPLITIHDDALPEQLFRRLWRRVRALGRERFRESYWTTFWFDLASPCNVVDEAVLALRARFSDELPSDARGVEWWLGRTDLRDVPIELHADRDNHLFDRARALRHPERSSVLYFNRVRGGCLLVTDQHPSRDGTRLIPEEAREYELARPLPNRFVHFQGDRVHGVLDANNEVPTRRLKQPAGRLRYALVVNWWRRRPEEVPSWDGSIYAALGLRNHGKDVRPKANEPKRSRRKR